MTRLAVACEQDQVPERRLEPSALNWACPGAGDTGRGERVQIGARGHWNLSSGASLGAPFLAAEPRVNAAVTAGAVFAR
ncbi:MAG: hypothetical protein WA895_21190 [Streptosporangiaceae bacterium]